MAMTDGVPAVFLDKDGTLLENVPYNTDPARMRFRPGAESCLKLLDAAGYRLFVVTNQSGVARGMFPESALAAVESGLATMIKALDVRLSGFYYCPHAAPGDDDRDEPACGCRKPAPGMLLRAAREHGLSLKDSWLIGDILQDVEAGRRAACRTVLVPDPGVRETAGWQPADFTVTDLEAAARVILSRRTTATRHPSEVCM
jgi:D-glycero-D-manno-heptose 1,7-bisphosphate phosphatase